MVSSTNKSELGAYITLIEPKQKMAEHAPVAGDQPVVVEERATTYSVFQTSIAKLQTTRWKFKMNWAPHSVDQARDLLRAAPIRDKRALSEKGIFRML